ncbi:MAG: M48 family metallopeptidase [Paludibacteraceae bacterium]|nr:M48 family metallopeptidase [Paludibacteraceae bacterium]
MKKLIVIVAIIALGACSSVPITGRKQMMLVSDAEVLSMSLSSYQEYMKTAKISTNTTQTAMVKNVGSKIAAAVENYLRTNGLSSEIKNFKWEFNLVQDKVPNAFCMPGGKVVVNEGILPITATETGLAVVVGHEIAHAVAKHGNERMSQQLAAQLGGELLSVALQTKSAQTQTIWSSVYGLGAQVGVILPYSRTHEYEADKLGMIFMAMAGYDVNECVSFWQRMKTLSGGKSSPEFLSTHPSDDNRIAEMKKNIPEALKYKK